MGSACNPDSLNICGADLVAGQQYQIEADVYVPLDAYVGDGAMPANAVLATYGDFKAGNAFTVGQ